jgi:hypothetical protein
MLLQPFTRFTCALVVATLSLDVLAADPIKLKIPCGSAPWLSCEDLKAKLIDGAPGDSFPGGMKAAVREMLDDVYDMKVRVAKNLVGQEECTSFDHLNKPPLCSPLKIPENGCVDETKKAFRVPASTPSANCPPISMVGAATDDHPLFSLGRSATGSIETSNVAAALLLAVSNEGASISDEIAKNELAVPDTSPCYSKAAALKRLIDEQSDVKLIEKINACDPNDQTQSCSAKEYFKGDLAAILSAYVQVAKCRLADESTKKFVAFTRDPGTPMKGYTDVLKDLFIQKCFYPNKGNPTAMRSCYSREYSKWINARARAAFPNVVAGCP